MIFTCLNPGWQRSSVSQVCLPSLISKQVCLWARVGSLVRAWRPPAWCCLGEAPGRGLGLLQEAGEPRNQTVLEGPRRVSRGTQQQWPNTGLQGAARRSTAFLSACHEAWILGRHARPGDEGLGGIAPGEDAARENVVR